jgi:hypothetical protein
MHQEVRWFHNEVVQACGRSDYIINDLVMVVTQMLNEETADRPNANLVRKMCQQAILKACELTASFPPVFLTQKEARSRPQTPPEVPPGLSNGGLRIDMKSRPSVRRPERPGSAEHSPSSSSGSPERSTYTYNPHHSIDTMMSNGSPISMYHRLSGRPSSQDLDPAHGTPPVSASPLLQDAPSEIPLSQSPDTMTAQLPYRNSAISPMNDSIPIFHNKEFSIGRSNEVAQTGQSQSHVSSTQAQVERKPYATIEEVLIAIGKKKKGVFGGPILKELLSLPSLNGRDQVRPTPDIKLHF